MALSTEHKARLNALHLPDDACVRMRLERWMGETGWDDFDIADAVKKPSGDHYKRSSVALYRHGLLPDGDNPANTLAMRAALVALMDANPSVLERSLKGETYHTDSYHKLSRAFSKALNRGWVYCIDGSPGTQKTRLLLALRAETQKAEANNNGQEGRVLYVYCRQRMSRMDLLKEILLSANLAPRGRLGKMIRKVRHHFCTRRVLLILDEAHHLDNDALETVRELVDEPPHFGLLFAGSHDIKRKFHELKLEQWRSRVQKFIALEGLREEEVRDIWEKEIGAINEKEFRELLKYCRVKDGRTRRLGEAPREYLSARQLFFAIDQAKAQDQREGNE
jgi:hypothetical protein